MGMFDDLIPPGSFDDLVPTEPVQADSNVNPSGLIDSLKSAFFTVHDATTGVGMGIPFKDELMAGAATPFRVAGRAITGADEGQSIGERFGSAYDVELEQQRQIEAQARSEEGR